MRVVSITGRRVYKAGGGGGASEVLPLQKKKWGGGGGSSHPFGVVLTRVLEVLTILEVGRGGGAQKVSTLDAKAFTLSKEGGIQFLA